MKATGIVRRIDDLGRVVIPKEVRRTMKIHEGDPLEIYLKDDAVIFKKYSLTNTLEYEAAYTALRRIGIDAAILNTDGDILKGTNDWREELVQLSDFEFWNEMCVKTLAPMVKLWPILDGGKVIGHIIYRPDAKADIAVECAVRIMVNIYNKN